MCLFLCYAYILTFHVIFTEPSAPRAEATYLRRSLLTTADPLDHEVMLSEVPAITYTRVLITSLTSPAAKDLFDSAESKL